jgi:hypothetical protein
MPIGESIPRPPANGFPCEAVWQAVQSLAFATYCPRETNAESIGPVVMGGVMGGVLVGHKAKARAIINNTIARMNKPSSVFFIF